MAGNMDKELIEYLLSIGALEYSFTSDVGDVIYRFTPEAKTLVPELYEEHIREYSDGIFSLWTKDVIEVSFDDDGEPLIGLNENSLNKDLIFSLEPEERELLADILEAYRRKEGG